MALTLPPVSRFALAVFAAGLLMLAGSLDASAGAALMDPVVWALIGVLVAGEFLPITIRRRDSVERLTASAPFMFGLLLHAGPGPAMLAVMAASAASDLYARRPWDRVVFNMGQYVLSLGAAGFVLSLAGHGSGSLSATTLGVADLWVLVPAGIAVFAVNHVLVSCAIALTERTRLLAAVMDDLLFQIFSIGVLFALAPVVVVVATRSLWLLPCLLIPVLALHRSTQRSVEDAERAGRDDLTALPNRGRFQEALRWALDRAATSTQGAVLLLDLDRFGEVNDTLGHAAGDELLRVVATALPEMVPAEATVGRLGGDEFGILLPGLSDPQEALELAERLVEELHQPCQIDQLSLHVRPSVGVACYPGDGTDSETLLRRADIAMRVAKQRPSGAAPYSSEHDRGSRRRLQLANDLRAAIADGQIEVHFQPQADVQRNRVVGMEALARWVHPSLGRVSPDEFIPLAEHAGLIDQLTSHVLDVALEQCALWRRAGFELSVAVNLSVKSMHGEGLIDLVKGALARGQVGAGALHLEVTESTIMQDHERAGEDLQQLRDLGVRLAVDDFGTGYSSLAHLKHLPVDYVKIDKSFVRDMHSDLADAAIVQSAVTLAHALGRSVIAEGVETEDVWEQLVAMGCELVQGYHLSRPLPAGEVMVWLLERIPERAPGMPLAALTDAGRPPAPARPVHPSVTPLFRRTS